MPQSLPTGNFDLRGALLDVGGLRRQQPVADDIEREPAGAARGDRHRHGVARTGIPACRARLPAYRAYRRWPSAYQPASNSTEVTGPFGSAVDDIEPVAAEIHRQRNARRLVGGGVDGRRRRPASSS